MTTYNVRNRLLASSMISGVALVILSAGAAQAADPTATTAPAATKIQTLDAAADAAAAADTSSAVGEVVVTGSLIPQPNLKSISPVTSVSSQEFKFEGTTNVETLLQNLPGVVPEFNQGVDNGSTGTASVDLRGLSSKRTLVLVNGMRLMPGDPVTTDAPDLNNIPAAMVDHVEILTGGASSVYGSDAMAGVVNFIMKKDFEGFRLDASGGAAFHINSNTADRANITAFNAKGGLVPITLPTNQVDAGQYDVTAIIGANSPDGKGNVTAYGEYRHLDPLGQGARDYGACGIGTESSGATNAAGNIYDTQLCLGSSNSAFAKFGNLENAQSPISKGKVVDGLADNPNGTNTFVPYNSNAFAFNFGPYNYYQEDDDKYSAGFFAHYDWNEHVQFYSNFMFADDKQVSQAAPSGLFSTSGPVFSTTCNNPLASASQQAALCDPTNPNVTLGTDAAGVPTSTGLTIAYRFAGIPRVTDLQHTSYTIIVGARGAIDDAWSYDFHLQDGTTSFREIFTGDLSINRINEALDVVPTATGPQCQTAISGADASCVPLNIFVALAKGLTPQQINFVSVPAFKVGDTNEKIGNITITGDLGKYGFKMPWATDGAGVAFGGEYREETLSLSVDNEFASGDLSGAGGVNPPASGFYSVAEGFVEGRLPIAQDQPWAKLLQAEAGYRYSSYSLSGQTNAYKISGEWQPIDDVRFRGGYNRAVRAPNILELFTPNTVDLESFGDPCSGTSPKATLAQCELTGVTAANYGNVPDCGAAQCSAELGAPPAGQPALKPEQADTFTAGVVFQPHWVRGLNFSVDWYSIDILNPITTYGGSTIVSQCVDGIASFCKDIHRDPNDRDALFGINTTQGYVIDTNVNSGYIRTSGLDFVANYRLDLEDMGMKGGGSVEASFNGSYLINFTTEPVAGLGNYDCAGLYGLVCLEPDPKWKHEMRVTWNTPWDGLSLSVNWRYVGPVSLDINTSNTFLAVEGVGFLDSADAKLPAANYVDLAMNWRIRDKLDFRAGINNVGDLNPPIVDANVLGIAGTSGFGNGNTYPGVYDTIGRSFYMGITADF
ncbi:MAG TPA: TonB-dependent receptor [Caulobacteraceae bacterium]